MKKTALTLALLALCPAAWSAEGSGSKRAYNLEQQISADIPMAVAVREALGLAAPRNRSASMCAAALAGEGVIPMRGSKPGDVSFFISKTGDILDLTASRIAVETIGTRIVCAVALGDHVSAMQTALMRSPVRKAGDATRVLADLLADQMHIWTAATIDDFNRAGIDILAEHIDHGYSSIDADRLPWPFRVVISNNGGQIRPYSIYSPMTLTADGKVGGDRSDFASAQSKIGQIAHGGIFEARTIGPGPYVAKIQPQGEDQFTIAKNGVPYWSSNVIAGRTIRLQITSSGRTQFLGE